MPHAREHELELLVIARSPESHALHALIDSHDRSLPIALDEKSSAHWRATCRLICRSKRTGRRNFDGASDAILSLCTTTVRIAGFLAAIGRRTPVGGGCRTAR